MSVQWRKSSYTGSPNDDVCVEVARLPQGIGIRDSKNPDGDRLMATGAEFDALLKRIKDGDLDRP